MAIKYMRSILNVLFVIIQVMAHWIFKLIYCKKGDKMPPIKDLILLESATSLAMKIRTGKLTSVEVLDSFIKRINEANSILNCVVAERFEEARKEAESADNLIKSSKFTPEILAKERPFLGVPFTTKDCISVKGMIHSSGLVKRKHIIADRDADVVINLKKSGAYPIALTNVSELCMWWESNNNVHGRSNNPYDTNHIVGGSSGGEGCCQAASCSAFGIGSDIGGSIRMPAFFNGIFGHKPSKFLVSTVGQYPKPLSKEQESFLGIGPMCRRAEDLVPLLKILIGEKLSMELKLDEDCDLRKMKFFYQDCDTGSVFVSPVNKEIRALFRRICQHLDKAHKIKCQQINLNGFSKSAPIWFANMKVAKGPTFADLLTEFNGPINPLIELIKWAFNLSDHTLISILTVFADKIGVKYGSTKHNYFIKKSNCLRDELMNLLGDNGVFLYPTHPTPAPYHNEPILKPFNFSYTGIINILGFPATHIPMGLNSDGIPIGIQAVSNVGNDRLCLAVAREFEKAFGGWVPPTILA